LLLVVIKKNLNQYLYRSNL